MSRHEPRLLSIIRRVDDDAIIEKEEPSMTTTRPSHQNLIAEIWQSFRSLPGWVQIWVAFLLVPVNMASLLDRGSGQCRDAAQHLGHDP